jgi:glycosyltransferase involved in cell wall biosynthesis
MPKKPLRVLQLIDSLNAGGSERMAVQLANLLSYSIELSVLVSTRHSGILEESIHKTVVFRCLHKKSRFDVSALEELKTFINVNEISIIHAHGTSFFMASIIKCLKPSLKIIWHDHYGFRYQTKIKDNLALYFCSYLFNHIITINSKLSEWSKSNLVCKNISSVENFSIKPIENNQIQVYLKGQKQEFKIIHVANLRPEKDHITALKAIKLLLDKGFKVSYHSIGAINDSSEYFRTIETFIKQHNLKETAFFYGSQPNVYAYLRKADLGLLSSISEGFPVSLIEYANAKLPVVATDVGDCKKIVGAFGKIVNAQDSLQLANAIEKNIKNLEESKVQAHRLCDKVNKTYNHDVIMDKIIDIYTTVSTTN